MPDNLKVPYKYGMQSLFSQFKLRNIFDRNVGTNDVIDATALQGILNDFLTYLSDQYRQNWLEIERHANRVPTGGGSTVLWDAIIDPILTAADPTNHRYPNFHSLVDNEVWSTDYIFGIGMVNRPGTPVVETVNTTPPGPFVIEGLGVAGLTGAANWNEGSADGGRAQWDFRSAQIGLGTKSATIRNISMYRSTSGSQNQIFTGSILMDNSVFIGTDPGGTANQRINKPCDGVLIANNSGLVSPNLTDLAYLTDTNIYLKIAGNATISSASIWWDGGALVIGGNPNNPDVVSFTGNSVYVRLDQVTSSIIFGSTGSGAPIIGFGTTSTIYFECPSGETNGIGVIVGAGAGPTVIRGTYADVTISGNTNKVTRDIVVDHTGVADITGPAKVQLVGRGQSATVKIRGIGVRADIELASATANVPLPGLDLIGADDCLITAVLIHTGTAGTSKPYAIDAGSDRSILITTGTNTGWGAAGTNASGSTIVRDETTL